jgi:hypothetical protein
MTQHPVPLAALNADVPLAFGFASPALLWGLALASAPIIIHLLNQRKYRETSWAAMRFLLEAIRKNSRRLQIEQLILLAVRALILVLVVLAVAEPLLDHLGSFFKPRQSAHRIIVIDASLSMGFQPREENLFDRAKETARAIVEDAHRGDVFNVVRLSNLPPAVIVPTPAYQTTRVIEEIDQMQLPHGRGDLPGCLAKVDDLLKLAPEFPNKEVVVISDFQRATWQGGSADETARVRELLKKIGAAARLVLVDLGQNDAANVAVTSLESLDTLVTTARAARFRAVVRNFGPERVTGRLLEFLADERLVAQRSVDVNASGEAVEEFEVPFAYGGEHRVSARLQKDALPLDDQRWLAAPVKDRLRVLCVSGGQSGGGRGRVTDYLELALAPAGASPPAVGGVRRGQIESTVISDGELAGFDLTAYDCVFLCNVRIFTEREAQTIETFLKGGGGVVWCLGDQVSTENYNQLLYRQGKGVLPAKLGDRQGDPDQRENLFVFDPGDFAHPIVSAFQGNPNAGLETTTAYAYIKTALATGAGAHVALEFDSGDPAIVEMPVGRGRSILVTTSVDERWGTWPLWPSFLPLIHEIVQFAVAGRAGDRQRMVGEPLTEIFAATAVDVDVAVGRPDGQTQSARVVRQESLDEFVYEDTSESGIYEVNFAHPIARSELFAVNVDPRESNLAKYLQDELADEVLAGTDFSYQTNWPGEDSGPADAPSAERGGLSRWILYGLLYLMFTEQMLAWDFRKGLWLLCPVIPMSSWLVRRFGR